MKWKIIAIVEGALLVLIIVGHIIHHFIHPVVH